MLDSKAVASVIQAPHNRFTLAIRQDFEENLGIYSFTVLRKTFESHAQALVYFKTNYPQGVTIPFEDLTTV